jgi:glutathione S-transferase
MTRLRIHGTYPSRVYRVLWAAGELGLDYEQVPTNFNDDTSKCSSYLAVNPNGKVPAIEDGDFQLWESMAINLYLAKKYGVGGLYPTSLEGEALAWQWSFWAVNELEQLIIALAVPRVFFPSARDPRAEQEAERALVRPLRVLNQALSNQHYLLGTDFTIADLNVAGIMTPLHLASIDLSAVPTLATWLSRCLGRPAALAVSAKRSASAGELHDGAR